MGILKEGANPSSEAPFLKSRRSGVYLVLFGVDSESAVLRLFLGGSEGDRLASLGPVPSRS